MSDRPSLLRTLSQGRYLRLAAACLLAAVVCTAAGVWQYHRWQGKHGANAELRGSAAAAPVPAGALLATDRALPATDRFRLVTARGSWDAAGELYVRQRQVNNEVAFLVVTPLRTANGPALLVVRGWQPATGSATQRPVTPAPPAGEVTITGRAYPSETGGLGAGLPDRQIQRIDTAAIGRRLANGPGGGAGNGPGSGPGDRPGNGPGSGPGNELGGGPGDRPGNGLGGGPGGSVYDGYVELTSQRPDPGTLPMLPAPDLTNPAGGADEWQHLAYVVQWFCFAVLALAAPVLLAVLERREPTTRREPDAPDLVRLGADPD